jgi:protein-disulfide isomerase
MKTHRVLIALVLLTIAMQGMLLVQQYRHASATAAAGDRAIPVETLAVRNARDGIKIDLANMPIKGKSDARVVLVEFSDYQCPFCARHATSVGPELERRFVATGKIRLAFANNPLPFHLNAKALATAAICAGDQGRYWEMHDSLFAKQPKTPEEIVAIVQSLRMDVAKFEQCRDHNTQADKQIAKDSQKAQQLEMNFTPGFAIGIADDSGQVKVRKLISGAQPSEVFTRALDEVLSESNQR